MKKAAKRIAGMVFCLAILASCVMIPPARADYNTVELDATYLDKEKCWTEAGNFLHLGMSQPRIAAEIYAHAMVDNGAWKAKQVYGNSWETALEYAIAAELENHAHVVNLGGDADWMVNLYYFIWNQGDKNNDNTYYYIHSKMDWNKVVDVSGNCDDNGTKIQLWSKNNSDAQQFAFYPTGDGWYTIFKKNTFQCLDVSGGVAADEVKVQLYEYNGTAAQQWRLIPVYYGEYCSVYCYLQNRLGYFMDAQWASTADGTQIWTYTQNWSDAQQWYIEYAG